MKHVRYAVQTADGTCLEQRAAEPRQRVELGIDHRSDARHASFAATTRRWNMVAFTARQAVEDRTQSTLDAFALLESRLADVEERSLIERQADERLTESRRPGRRSRSRSDGTHA